VLPEARDAEGGIHQQEERKDSRMGIEKLTNIKNRLDAKNGRQDRIVFLEELLDMHALVRSGEYTAVVYKLANQSGESYQYTSSSHFVILWMTHYQTEIENTSDTIPELRAKLEILQILELDQEDEPLWAIRTIFLNQLENTIARKESDDLASLQPIEGEPTPGEGDDFVSILPIEGDDEQEQSYRDMAIQTLQNMTEAGIQPLAGLYEPYFSPLLEDIDTLAECLSSKTSVENIYECYNEVGVNDMLARIEHLGSALLSPGEGPESPTLPLLPARVNNNTEMIDALFTVKMN
jgi:hypothetical protein